MSICMKIVFSIKLYGQKSNELPLTLYFYLIFTYIIKIKLSLPFGFLYLSHSMAISILSCSEKFLRTFRAPSLDSKRRNVLLWIEKIKSSYYLYSQYFNLANGIHSPSPCVFWPS